VSPESRLQRTREAYPTMERLLDVARTEDGGDVWWPCSTLTYQGEAQQVTITTTNVCDLAEAEWSKDGR
jgi:hypothetical protein